MSQLQEFGHLCLDVGDDECSLIRQHGEALKGIIKKYLESRDGTGINTDQNPFVIEDPSISGIISKIKDNFQSADCSAPKVCCLYSQNTTLMTNYAFDKWLIFWLNHLKRSQMFWILDRCLGTLQN